MIAQRIPVLQGGPDAYLDFDFRFGQEAYWINRQRYGDFTLVPGATSTGGAGFGTVQRNGVWQSVAANAPLIGDGGLGVWEGRQNVQARSYPNGAVPGSPGTMPTGWGVTGNPGLSNGVTRSVVGAGVDATTGIPYVDIALVGTFVAAENVAVNSGTAVTATPASPGQVWSASLFWSVVSGTLPSPATPNVNGIRVRYGSPGLLAQTGSSDTPNTNFAARQLSENRTAPASTTVVGTDWHWTFAAGQAINCVVRFGLMQLEQGAFASPPIFTEATAATRTAVAQSVGGLVLPSGDFDIEQVWETGPAGVVGRAFEYHNGSDLERLLVLRGASGALQALIVVGGASAQIGNVTLSIPPQTIVATKLQKRGGIWRFIVNDVQFGADTAAGTPAVNTVALGYRRAGPTDWLNGPIQRHRLRAA